MSIIIDQVRHVDSQLNRIHILQDLEDKLIDHDPTISSSPKILELQRIIKAFSTTSLSPLIQPSRISALLERATQLDQLVENNQPILTRLYENDLYWLVVSKAAVQIYGLMLGELLDQTISINDHIWYWDKVLGSYTYSSLFAIQTSPLRLWAWAKQIYCEAGIRFTKNIESPGIVFPSKIKSNFFGLWEWFHGLIRGDIKKRSIKDLQHSVLSPIALCRNEARHHQLRLKRWRETGASGLGILTVEGLNFNIKDDYSDDTSNEGRENHEWRTVVEQSIVLMSTVLSIVSSLETGVSEFEDRVFVSVVYNPEASVTGENNALETVPAKLISQMQHILKVLIPNYNTFSKKFVRQHGQPSRTVRLWFPTFSLLLSSTTILRLFVIKKEVIISYIQDFGSTARDFCLNWVLEPIKKVISTIRHDPDSELALMSKESLSGDRESLERMVTDFARDRSYAISGNSSLTESQLYDIRAKVREGDLTPVLRAYEKDLRHPLLGTIRGDLIRTLLIQVQKTKVDVEVALSGIDALLKSQELVFGFVGLTPGVVICFAIIRYFAEVLSNLKGFKKVYKSGQSSRILRNIDRILTVATPIKDNLLSYKDHGLILCEVHTLRNFAHKLIPGEVERDFLEDVTDLCSINLGLRAQRKALKRIKWSYARWLQ